MSEKPPLLQVVLDALRERGWTIGGDGALVDPEGNRYFHVEDAISAQTFREIGQA